MILVRYGVGLLVALAVLAVPLLALSYSEGAPAAFSGPEQYCNACHGGSDANPVNSGTGSVTITAQAWYAPGEVVPITVTIDNTSVPSPELKQGFELSARIPDSGPPLEHAGSFDLGGSTLVQFAQGDPHYVTHTGESNQMTSWTFSWVAPDADPPEEVVFYVAGNAANGNGIPDDGDKIYAATHSITRQGVAVEPEAVPQAVTLAAPYPNPVRDRATATYTLARPGEVTALLRDGRGRTVRVLEAGARPAGSHALRLDAGGLAAGTYFLTVTTEAETQTQVLSVVR